MGIFQIMQAELEPKESEGRNHFSGYQFFYSAIITPFTAKGK